MHTPPEFQMRRVTTTVRSYCTPRAELWKVIKLAKLWEKYNPRRPALDPTAATVVKISRNEDFENYYSHLQLRKNVPHVILDAKHGPIEKAKSYVKAYMRNGFVRGLRLDEEKDLLLNNGKEVFFEILRAYRENDFSELTEHMLGGNQTLQFHRNAAQNLTTKQKESLNITQEDLLGKSGYLIKFPYFKSELGPYMHSIDIVSVDAVGNDYFKEGEDGKKELKLFCRYKMIMGGIYKFESLLKDVLKGEGLWSQKIKTPRDYGFQSPRYTFVELDVCQEAERKNTRIRLTDNRHLYDFHVISF